MLNIKPNRQQHGRNECKQSFPTTDKPTKTIVPKKLSTTNARNVNTLSPHTGDSSEMALYSIMAKVQGSRNGRQIANEKSQDPTQTRTTTPSSGGKQASSDTTLQTQDLTEAIRTVYLCLPLRQKRRRHECKLLQTRRQGPNRMFETFSSRTSRQGRTATTRSEKGKKLITSEEYKRNKHSQRLAENHITNYGKEQICRQIPEHYFRQKETVDKSHTKQEKQPTRNTLKIGQERGDKQQQKKADASLSSRRHENHIQNRHSELHRMRRNLRRRSSQHRSEPSRFSQMQRRTY